jgi:alkanesulfonate monooxygenase SsuD/methylene tetrahydromethanopterin reductase-like flavin-dependent oxidoreductase (luciferase family)
VRFGLFQTVQWPEGSQQHQLYLDAIEQVVLADELGFDLAWLTELHFTRHAITSDSLALLAHIAAKTRRIRLGTAVAVLPFHDPVRLAESIALVDHLCDGRLDVGIGRGYQYREYHGFGIPLNEGTERFEEALEVLLRSWAAEEPFAFEGTFSRYDAAWPQPKPYHQPHPPLCHATTGADGLRRCAENDWGIVLAQGTTLASVGEVLDRYREQLELVGRPYSPERVTIARGMFCGATDEEALAAYVGPYRAFLDLAAEVSAAPSAGGGSAPRNPFQVADEASLLESLIVGSPDTCEGSLRVLEEMGIGNVIFFVNLGGLTHASVVESLRRFATDVLPRFRG